MHLVHREPAATVPAVVTAGRRPSPPRHAPAAPLGPPGPAPVDPESLTTWLVSRVARLLGVGPHLVRADQDVRDLDLDSAEALLLVDDLEKELGVRVPAGWLWLTGSLGGLAEQVVAAGPTVLVAIGTGAPGWPS
ncbi:acyl carrier protein [Phycicoccus flavus]|uniref:Acyl carrier protein n=1 Tax=Phycicoccus flavus TaxID=2502783 RepID=A0A8T6R250_9MICO|nr:acyl carrier protein [Phycicoccus flavus]NHA67713.1 acyl carrier protein [Phycicoccus flavus]